MDKINITVQITVKADGGLMVSKLIDMDVEAFSEIKGTVPMKEGGTDGEVIIAVHPMDDASEVQLLLITRDSEFEEADEGTLKYNACQHDGNDLTNGAEEYDLNGELHLFTGDMIKATVQAVAERPHYLKFTNASDKEVMVRILVGRSASPTQAPSP